MERLWALTSLEAAPASVPTSAPTSALGESSEQAMAGVTVREVLESLEGDRDVAYTTVMTVLDRLTKKALVTRERDGRAWRYLPAGSREALTAQTIRRTLDDMEVTDRRAALMHFLDGATEDELSDLKAALDELERRPRLTLRRPRRRHGSADAAS